MKTTLETPIKDLISRNEEELFFLAMLKRNIDSSIDPIGTIEIREATLEDAIKCFRKFLELVDEARDKGII